VYVVRVDSIEDARDLADARLALADTFTQWGSTRWAELSRCPKAAHLRYGMGVTPIDTAPALEIGKLFHACRAYALGAWPRTRDDLDVLTPEVLAGFEHDPESVAEARRLVEAYVARWGADGGWPKVLGVEVGHDAVLEGVRTTGRSDLEVEVGGRVAVVDYKTMAGLREGVGDNELAAEYRTRPQFAQLSALVREARGLSYWPDVIADVIVKVKVPRFRRVVISFDDAIMSWHTEAQQYLAHGVLPDVTLYNPHACVPRPQQRCWAFAWCHGSDDDRATLYSVGPVATKEETR
jgi:hypothetical protein